jgi:hypothetical protein
MAEVLIIGGATTIVVSAIPIIAGFGAGGIVVGSVAAAAQALIGNVSAGSVFATLTSWGMKALYAKGVVSGTALMTTGILIP